MPKKDAVSLKMWMDIEQKELTMGRWKRSELERKGDASRCGFLGRRGESKC
jgi:hypothetical protein